MKGDTHKACKHVRDMSEISSFQCGWGTDVLSLHRRHPSIPFWVKAGGGAQNQGVEHDRFIID